LRVFKGYKEQATTNGQVDKLFDFWMELNTLTQEQLEPRPGLAFLSTGLDTATASDLAIETVYSPDQADSL